MKDIENKLDSIVNYVTWLLLQDIEIMSASNRIIDKVKKEFNPESLSDLLHLTNKINNYIIIPFKGSPKLTATVNYICYLKMNNSELDVKRIKFYLINKLDIAVPTDSIKLFISKYEKQIDILLDSVKTYLETK